jgi:uncharacterized membrane protein required for colicin V production
MQSPPPTDWSTEILARLATVAWFDWTALAVVCVFLFLGLAKGLRWQVTRLAGLVAAYAAAILGAEPLADALPAGLVGGSPSPMALHTLQILLFLAVLVGLGLVFHTARRFVVPAEPTLAGRALAAVVGIISGSLWTLALLTASQLVLDGWSVAAAARASKSADYGSRALRYASTELLPDPLADGAAAWGALLDAGEKQPASADADHDSMPSPTLVPRASRD